MSRDVDYTLLEIIEGPKRINNIKHENLFDYLIQSTETQERFESFMGVLEQQVPWAYLGIGIMASDMLPISKLLESELAEEIVDVRYNHGSVNEFTIFKMILNYCDRGFFSEERHRKYVVHYMAETLAADEYAFVIGCIKQTYKREIFEHMKAMCERGKMGNLIKPFFSFAINRAPFKIDTFTKFGIPVKKYSIVKKVGACLFNDKDEVLAKDVSDKILMTVQKPNAKPILPRVCELYIEEGNVKPFMCAAVEGVIALRDPMEFSDDIIVDLIYKGCSNFFCTNGANVVSIISADGGTLERVIYKCKAIKKISLPLVFINLPVSILAFKDDEGNEMTALISQNVDVNFRSGSHLSFIKYKNVYYFEGVYDMEEADA